MENSIELIGQRPEIRRRSGTLRLAGDSKDANSVLTDIENRFQNGYSEIIWFNGHYVNYAGNLSSFDQDGIQYYKFGFISEGDYQEDIFTEDGINKNLTFSIYGR